MTRAVSLLPTTRPYQTTTALLRYCYWCRRFPTSSSFHTTTTTVAHNDNETTPTKSSQQEELKQGLPSSADVIVVGGGIIGTSVAYHLAQKLSSSSSNSNILLLERHRLTSGTTWHAAGLMNSFGSLSSTSTWMRQYSQDLYQRVLPAETGLSTGYQQIGFVELACDVARLEQYRRVAAFNRYCGVQVDEIGPADVQAQFPACHVDDVLAGFLVEADGRANPTDVTLALAKGAKRSGRVQIVEHCPVAGVTTKPSPVPGKPPSVTGVRLQPNGSSSGEEIVIAADAVVNCTGMWARQFGAACGVYNLPNQPAEHYYLLTEPLSAEYADSSDDWPVIEDASKSVYIRPEVGGGLLLGLFEPTGVAAHWHDNKDDVPNDLAFGELAPDWERMMPHLERALERLVPAVRESVGLKQLFCGPESFTVDGCPMVGESPELERYYVAAGLNSLGILTGGGVGHVLADWIVDGHPPDQVDVTGIHVNRFHRHQANAQFRRDRVGEVLGHTYQVHYPQHSWQTCRNVKQSALHASLQQAGACFRDVSGWESPAFYNPNDTSGPTHMEPSFGKNVPWWKHWAAEHHACRNSAALFDMSFMSKFLVQGRDAGRFLNHLSTANVAEKPGQITYTQWLNPRGYMEADVTVAQLNDHSFWVICTDTMHNHVQQHFYQHLTEHDDYCVTLTDITARYTQLNLQGPQSRNVLQQLTSHNVSNETLPFRSFVELDVAGYARAWCARITYVGELGFELYIPIECSRHVYQALLEAGQQQQQPLQHAGLLALGSLRLEKGYRDYGHDMDNSDTLLECGLGFTCDFEKDRPFVGQDAVQRQKAQSKAQGGLHRRLVSVCVPDHPPVMLHGHEIVWRNGQAVGDVRVGSYGHTLGGAVGLALLHDAQRPITKRYCNDDNSKFQVQVGNDFYPCQVSLSPFYDPKSLRVKM